MRAADVGKIEYLMDVARGRGFGSQVLWARICVSGVA